MKHYSMKTQIYETQNETFEGKTDFIKNNKNLKKEKLVYLQDLDLRDAGGRILGYRVTYETKQQPRRRVQNVTAVTALLVVEEGNCSVAVAAFNSAGYGPAARLAIDPRRRSGEWRARRCQTR